MKQRQNFLPLLRACNPLLMFNVFIFVHNKLIHLLNNIEGLDSDCPVLFGSKSMYYRMGSTVAPTNHSKVKAKCPIPLLSVQYLIHVRKFWAALMEPKMCITQETKFWSFPGFAPRFWPTTAFNIAY